MVRVIVAAIFVLSAGLLAGPGSANASSAAATPKTELKTYFAALDQGNAHFAQLKRRTRASMDTAYGLGTMTLDMVTGTGPGPSMADITALVANLAKRSSEYGDTAAWLQTIQAPQALQAYHATLVGAVRAASVELANRTEPLESTVRDGSVNVGTIRYFDHVSAPMTKPDNMAKDLAARNGQLRQAPRHHPVRLRRDVRKLHTRDVARRLTKSRRPRLTRLHSFPKSAGWNDVPAPEGLAAGAPGTHAPLWGERPDADAKCLGSPGPIAVLPHPPGSFKPAGLLPTCEVVVAAARSGEGLCPLRVEHLSVMDSVIVDYGAKITGTDPLWTAGGTGV